MVAPLAGVAAGNIIWHAIQRFVSVIAVALVLGGVIWSVYVTLIKPHTNPTKTTSQNAEEIVNNDHTPKVGFGGCMNYKVLQYYKEKKQ